MSPPDPDLLALPVSENLSHCLVSILSLCLFSLRPFIPGLALIDASEAMKELGEVKDALDMEVKQNFIDPLQNLHDKDLKEIQVNKTPASASTDSK